MKRTSKIIAQLFLLFLFALQTPMSADGQDPPPAAGTIRIQAPLVNLYLNVTGKKGRLISDVTQEEFEIFEDGEKQEIRYFDRETDRPLTLAILFDTSGSQESVLDVEKWAATRFLEEVMREKDLALLITFDINVDLVQNFTSETERLEEGLKRAQINRPIPLTGTVPQLNAPGTLLYDAVFLASNQKLKQEVGRKAIILLTDGFDEGSRTKERKAIEAAQRADAIIYAIGISDTRRNQQAFWKGTRTLKKFAEETGGFAVFPKNEAALLKAFARIAAQLRTQYVLAYRPTNVERDGKFRKIKVKVKRKGTRVQARRGYYASTPEELNP